MTDERFERWIAALLRGGVSLAALIVLIGGVGNLLHNGHFVPSYKPFHREPAQYTSGGGILHAALDGDWLGLVQVGLLVLIATPVARVALAVGAFAAERDWIYVGITVIVLGILLYSLL
ncbi:MAG: DUF1634 domain-containing protein [Acidobacteriia bacterium]|nr:DUF1634 domain-containing protein [Terriglobia bacterium]